MQYVYNRIHRFSSRVTLLVWALVSITAPFEQSCATMPTSGPAYGFGAQAGAAGFGPTSLQQGFTTQGSSGSGPNSPRWSPAGSSSQTQLPVISGSLSQQSREITDYLQHHRLPLVEAEVRRDVTGRREVVLYGFVATPYGKSDAEAKVRRLLGRSDIFIDNEIKVRPELLQIAQGKREKTSQSAEQSSGGTLEASNPSANALPNMPAPVGNTSSYQSQSSWSWLSYALPILAIGGMIGLSFLGGGGGGFFPGYYPGYYPGYFFP